MSMLWFFQRDAAILELETRYDNATAEYVRDVRPPDGSAWSERFPDAQGFRARLQTIENGLIAEQWRREGPPIVLPYGWPDRKPPR